ncbi:MAG: two-component system, NtrC family, response regulator GlrR [Candidatus Binatota bacterium]|jgi:CheY-like chemotaxis protein|nr:two-component system, NtrC family, response regulator GlrR [Candidatus Binatota bacterium]
MISGSEDKRARILLVSPEANFYATLQRILGRCGYAIEVAATGEQALERIGSQRFDAIVSQVHLPGTICGVTLLQRLRAYGLEVPVVLLTEEQTDRVRRVLESSSRVTCVSQHADVDSLKSTLAACLASGR